MNFIKGIFHFIIGLVQLMIGNVGLFSVSVISKNIPNQQLFEKQMLNPN